MGAKTDAPRREVPDPDDLTNSIRAEIAAFFGGPQGRKADADRDRGGHTRLLADLESRILESLRAASPPPELGPFVLEERIGRGGFAVVYRATHKRTGARAAVKVVPASDPDSYERILSEVESLARLRHKNIVRVIDTGDDHGFAWIATEFISGMTLSDSIRQSHGPPENFQIGEAAQRSAPARPPRVDPAEVRVAMTWFRDLADALEALHKVGLVHHDVKPANILIDDDRQPVLIDFGLSSSAEGTVDGILAGTVPYMSPEQTLGGYVAITPRSDVYSLAATFHEVLTGKRVTRGARRESMLHQIAFVPVAAPSEVTRGIPSSLDPIFSKALAKDSNQRYASARDLAEDIDRWLTNRTLVHVREPTGVRVRRFARRHRIALALCGGLAVLAIAWGSMSFVTGERDYRDTIGRIRSALDRGEPLAALTILGSESPRFGGRTEFQQHYRESVLLGGEPFARQLLRSQAFAAAGLANRSEHARLAQQAGKHVAASRTPEPHLILVQALSRNLSQLPEEARGILAQYPEIVARSRPLMELEAILAIEQGNPSAYERAVTRLEATPRGDLTTTELCVRAVRHISCLRAPGFPKPSQAELKEIEDDLGRTLGVASDHALARLLLGRLKLERRDYRGARAEFDELVKKHGAAAERAGSLLFHGVAGLLVAQDAEGTERESLIRTAVSYAKEAIEADPGFADNFVAELAIASWEIRARWIQESLDGPWARQPAFGPGFLSFAANTICKPPPRTSPAVILALTESVEREYGRRDLSPPMMKDYVGVKALEVWALREHTTRAFNNGRIAEAREHAEESRERIHMLRGKVEHLPYLLIAWDALSVAFLAEIEENAAEKRKLCAEALAALRNASDSGLLDSAVEAAASAAEKTQVRELGAECSDRLEVLTDRMMEAPR